jgi:hypothetical protein
MIKGEYRGASLGWLVVVLVALGVWALVWGPSDDADEVPAGTTPTTTTTSSTTNTSSTTSTTESPPGDLSVDGPVVRRSFPYLDEGEDAGIWGTLEMNGGCLVIAYEEHEEVEITRFPVVWPAGTAWDAATESVVLATGDLIAIGEELRAGGGYYQPEALEALGDLSPAAIALLDRYATGEFREVARINNQADAVRPAS